MQKNHGLKEIINEILCPLISKLQCLSETLPNFTELQTTSGFSHGTENFNTVRDSQRRKFRLLIQLEKLIDIW